MVTLYSATDRSYDASLFRLGHALFGQLDLQLGESVTNDIRNRIASLRRKAAVSAWLEDHVAPSVEADLKKTLPSDSAAISFILLTGNQIEKATEAAIAGHNFKLATLISQGSGDTEFQADLLEQLTTWREHRIDAHISDSILRVYAVLAGWLNTIQGSTGTGSERCSDVVVCKGLDWKRVYGLHLWFAEPGEAPLPGIFQAYDQFWRENHTMPSIAPASPHPRSSWNLPAESAVPSATQDALFSLLKLQADPACSLSHILNPLSFSASPVDSSLPWHLYSILARGMRLRDFADRKGPFDDTSSGRGGGHSLSADLLTSSYAFELERLGMLQEAVFVLLHLESSFG
jgi:nuclear pore complex protein Nup98-Nup96